MWQPPFQGVVSYYTILRYDRLADLAVPVFFTAPGSATSFVDTTATTKKGVGTYYYTIQAIPAAGYGSPFSNLLTVGPLIFG